MKKNVAFLLLLICWVTSVGAQQKVKWALKPLKFDVDEIRPATRPIGKAKFYDVWKKDKVGMVNHKGKIIAPIRFDRYIEVWGNNQYVCGVINGKNGGKPKLYFYTSKGKKTDYKTVSANVTQQDAKPYLEYVVETLNNPSAFSIDESHKKLVIKGTNGSVIDMIGVSRYATLSKNKDIYSSGDNFYILSKNKKYSIKEYGKFSKEHNHLVVLNTKDWKYGLYDYDMHELLPKVYENITFSDDNKVFSVIKDENSTIYDYDLNVLRDGIKGYVSFLKDFAFYKIDGGTERFDFLTNKSMKLPYTSLREVRYSKNLVWTYRDKMKGIYDMAIPKLILEPKHKFLSLEGQFMVGTNKRSGLRTFHIYNRAGEKLIEIEGTDVDASSDYLLVSNETTSILNVKGEIIQDDITVKVSSHGFLRVSGDGFKTYYTTPANFFGGNNPELHFESIKKEMVRTSISKTIPFIVAQKGKYKGLINKDGSVVFDFIFDDIYPEWEEAEKLPVKFKGRMGVVLVPVIPLSNE